MHDGHPYSMPPDAIGACQARSTLSRGRPNCGRSFRWQAGRQFQPGDGSVLPEQRAQRVAALLGQAGPALFAAPASARPRARFPLPRYMKKRVQPIVLPKMRICRAYAHDDPQCRPKNGTQTGRPLNLGSRSVSFHASKFGAADSRLAYYCLVRMLVVCAFRSSREILPAPAGVVRYL
jgi:hypothetical protein